MLLNASNNFLYRNYPSVNFSGSKTKSNLQLESSDPDPLIKEYQKILSELSSIEDSPMKIGNDYFASLKELIDKTKVKKNR